jgi:hypothetical protein
VIDVVSSMHSCEASVVSLEYAVLRSPGDAMACATSGGQCDNGKRDVTCAVHHPNLVSHSRC